MTEFNNIIYRCLKKLNCNFSLFLNSKHERIKLQKYSYLIEKIFGIGIGRYSLYLNGPYNSILADELYKIARNENEYISINESNPLGQDTNQILTEIRNCFLNLDVDEVDLLELYTTFDFLRKYYPSYTNEQILEKLKKEKSHIFEHYETIDINLIIMDIDSRINSLIRN